MDVASESRAAAADFMPAATATVTASVATPSGSVALGGAAAAGPGAGGCDADGAVETVGSASADLRVPWVRIVATCRL
jgi:hypothetical protein